jgi:ribosome-dependent ATPase
VFHFGLTIKGSVPGLLLAGLVYVFAATAFGILISSFTRTQVAALIATAVITQVPVLSFSGFLSPAGGLEGVEALIGRSFPAYYFQNIAIGSFAKARGFLDLGQDYLAMFGLGVIYLCIARLLVRKQEA